MQSNRKESVTWLIREKKIERLLALGTIIATRFRLGEIARSRATEKYLKVTLPLGNVDGPLDE